MLPRKLNKEIAAIALPAIISNLTTPILSLVDVAISGHIGNAVYIAAIALGGTVFNMLYWLFGFLRMGTSGLTAQAYGANDTSTQAKVLYRALLIGMLTGIALIALSHPVGTVVLNFMDADDATAALARNYFNICIWGAPAVMISYALAGWFLGMQDSKAAMWMSIITNIVNIAVSLTLVFGFDMSLRGVAFGTMSAQWVGALFGLIVVALRYRPAFHKLKVLLEYKSLLFFFKINTDIFLRTCCLVAVTVWFTHAGALQGAQYLAANALLLQFFMIFSYFMDGFAFAGEALSGKYLGAGDNDGLKTVVNQLFKIGRFTSLIFTFLYFVLGDYFLELLASDQSVVATAIDYIAWAVLVPVFSYKAFIWDGILIGMVRPRIMLIAMAVSLVVFFVLYFIMLPHWGNNALWLAFLAYLFTRGLVENLLKPSELR